MPGVWELKLARAITELSAGKLTVAVKDRQGNVTRIERIVFSRWFTMSFALSQGSKEASKNNFRFFGALEQFHR